MWVIYDGFSGGCRLVKVRFAPKASMSPPSPQYDNYRVVLKLDGDEFEIGSISIQHDAAWRSVA